MDMSQSFKSLRNQWIYISDDNILFRDSWVDLVERRVRTADSAPLKYPMMADGLYGKLIFNVHLRD